jgi:hypothetical protein
MSELIASLPTRLRWAFLLHRSLIGMRSEDNSELLSRFSPVQDGHLPGDLEAAFGQLLRRFDACLHRKRECVERAEFNKLSFMLGREVPNKQWQTSLPAKLIVPLVD